MEEEFLRFPQTIPEKFHDSLPEEATLVEDLYVVRRVTLPDFDDEDEDNFLLPTSESLFGDEIFQLEAQVKFSRIRDIKHISLTDNSKSGVSRTCGQFVWRVLSKDGRTWCLRRRNSIRKPYEHSSGSG